MRKSPEGKWQKPSVPLDGATLAVMQEYVRMQWASLSTDMRLSCFPCFDWMIRPAVRSCLISRNSPFDRPMKQKWGDWVKNKTKEPNKNMSLLLWSNWTHRLIYQSVFLNGKYPTGSGSSACVTWPPSHEICRTDRSHPNKSNRVVQTLQRH